MTVRGYAQDLLRRWIGESLVLAGHLLNVRHAGRVEGYREAQARLRKRYGIEPTTPIRPWGPDVQRDIEHWIEGHPRPARYAMTSGTTDQPKRLAYPTRRVLLVKWAFIEAFCRLYAASEDLKRHSLYVFGSLDEDRSLTGMMVEEEAGPGYISTLQAPYRVHGLPCMRAARERYGDDGCRLWVLTLSNPGVLYATNPSTLSTFLDRVQSDWAQATAMVRDWVLSPARFEEGVHAVARRLASRGMQDRLHRVATAPTPLPPRVWAPAARTVVCWDGGYVAPFIQRLRTHLPAPEHRLIPMYSMSTETLQTVLHFPRPGDEAFLPLAPGVLYELLPEGAPDAPEHLVAPWDAKPGQAYTLVISDGYGLARYQTADLFECRRMVEGLPDLRFSRRRDLEYSFTGEKITAHQVQLALTELRSRHPALSSSYLTLLPTLPRGATVPGYVLAVLADPTPRVDQRMVARDADRALAAVNAEYAGKRHSGRLAPIRVQTDSPARFAARVSGQASWESQFKFLPLYRRHWETLAGPTDG